VLCGAVLFADFSGAAYAYTVTIDADAPQTIYLQVGVGSFTADYCGGTTYPPPHNTPNCGPAYGGGVGLVAVCDVAIAARGARFGLTEVRLGLLPANIGPYVVARLGPAKAREILFNGKLFAAEEAERLGLVSRAVDAAELDAAVEREAGYFLQCGPQAVARTKALVRHIARHGPSESIDYAIAGLADAWEGDESKEGIAAFFAKRKPRWAS